MNKKRSGKKRIIILVIVVLLLAALAFGGYQFFMGKKVSNTQSAQVMKELERLIPNLGDSSEGFKGLGREPLAALSIDGIDIVGVLEIPSLDLEAPVTAKDNDIEFFTTWVSGSPVKGTFRIKGGRDDVFLKLAKAKPGDMVAFTDVDGVRYEYTVTTQYHLKDWAEADNDLLLCYHVDEQTDFVLGCTKTF